MSAQVGSVRSCVRLVGPRACRQRPGHPRDRRCPGPTLVISVKGDIVDATRDLRTERGTVWAFDPQHILGADQGMWFIPLRAVSTITDARRLGEHFAAVEREPGVSRDAFIDPSSEELVVNLLLAAACSGRDILTGYRWAVSPRDDEPAMLLREHGFALPADPVSGVVNMPDKIRGGIYAGAQKMLMCLTEPVVTAWVTPPTLGGVLEFDPAAFVVSTDVLYLLCQGGPGSPPRWSQPSPTPSHASASCAPAPQPDAAWTRRC
ncbi:hypothetical protein ACX27O_15415 [Micromonospora sp. SD19]